MTAEIVNDVTAEIVLTIKLRVWAYLRQGGVHLRAVACRCRF